MPAVAANQSRTRTERNAQTNSARQASAVRRMMAHTLGDGCWVLALSDAGLGTAHNVCKFLLSNVPCMVHGTEAVRPGGSWRPATGLECQCRHLLGEWGCQGTSSWHIVAPTRCLPERSSRKWDMPRSGSHGAPSRDPTLPCTATAANTGPSGGSARLATIHACVTSLASQIGLRHWCHTPALPLLTTGGSRWTDVILIVQS